MIANASANAKNAQNWKSGGKRPRSLTRSVKESVRDPGPYFRVNCEAGRALLDGMRRHDVPRIVFSSTCAVYGRPPLPIREDSPRAP
ncbi:MAG: NAD-dependent epimerase/dehydratase family protein, partial [Chloroflexota bacterium]